MHRRQHELTRSSTEQRCEVVEARSDLAVKIAPRRGCPYAESMHRFGHNLGLWLGRVGFRVELLLPGNQAARWVIGFGSVWLLVTLGAYLNPRWFDPRPADYRPSPAHGHFAVSVAVGVAITLVAMLWYLWEGRDTSRPKS